MVIGGILHVNVNCTNFERSKAFYERLGFQTRIDFPDYANPDVCRTMGLQPTSCRGALLEHENQNGQPAYLDLLEWDTQEETRSRTLTEPGLARIALWTNHFDEAIAAMREIDADFLAEPESIEALGGNRLAFVCDPDGVVVEIIEQRAKE